MTACRKIPARWVLAIWGFLGFVNVYALRVNLSVALVAMVNGTAVRNSENSSSTSSSDCPAPDAKNSSEAQTDDGEFVWDEIIQGYILSSFFYGYILTQIPGGFLATKYSGKWLYGIGVLWTGVLTLLSPLAARWSLAALIVLRVLEGIGEGVTFPAMHAILGKWIPPLERSKIGVFVYSGPMVGTVVSMPISGYLCQSSLFGGWPSVFYIFGTLGVLWFIFWTALAHDSPDQHPRITQKEKDYIHHCIGINTQVNHSFPVKAAFSSLPFWAIIIGHTCWNWSWYTILTTLPTYLAKVLHFDIKENGFVSALPTLVNFFVAIAVSQGVDFLRSRGHLSTGAARRLANTFGLVSVAIGLVCIYFVGCDKLAAVLLLCFGVGMGGAAQAGYQVNHLDLAPQFAGLLLGITNTMATLPGMISPYVVGVLTNHQETRWRWLIVFSISASIAVFGAVFFLIFSSGELQPWAEDIAVIHDDDDDDDVSAAERRKLLRKINDEEESE